MKFATAAAFSSLLALPVFVSGVAVPEIQARGFPPSNNFNAPKPPFGGFQPQPPKPQPKPQPFNPFQVSKFIIYNTVHL